MHDLLIVMKFCVLNNQCWNKDWLARNQDNVSEWSDMSTRELLHYKIQLEVYYKSDIIISPYLAEKQYTNFKAFGLTRSRPGPESTIFRTQGGHANYYITDAV
jgi:hypothetical protein